MKHFHYIIAGAGCAGLSLLVRLLQSGKFSDKEILLIDKDQKKSNDRTWCFWERGDSFFEPVVHKSWQKLWVHGDDYSGLHDITPYRYKMIRSEDFYAYCFNIIQQFPNVTVYYGNIASINSDKKQLTLHTNTQLFTADTIFNSVQFSKPVLKENQYYLLQHFKGWVIETAQPAFTVEEATLMDFRVDQQYGTTFVYVMPLTATRALVEYTLFSKELLPDENYEAGLKQYISDVLKIPQYTIAETEFGIIPMTDYTFPPYYNGCINIGTAGGQTKASTGYTFRFIQKQTEEIVQNLIQNGKWSQGKTVPRRRFRWYDSTLLNILCTNKLPGSYIFTRLFKKNKATDIMQFLDNETRFMQEMKIITVLPKGTFIKAALQEWNKYF